MLRKLFRQFNTKKEVLEHEHLMFEAEIREIDVLQEIASYQKRIAALLFKIEGHLKKQKTSNDDGLRRVNGRKKVTDTRRGR